MFEVGERIEVQGHSRFCIITAITPKGYIVQSEGGGAPMWVHHDRMHKIANDPREPVTVEEQPRLATPLHTVKVQYEPDVRRYSLLDSFGTLWTATEYFENLEPRGWKIERTSKCDGSSTHFSIAPDEAGMALTLLRVATCMDE